MEVKLKVRRIRLPNKTYEYLYIHVPRSILETLSPELVVVSISEYPLPLKLKIKKFSDGSGYATIPRKVAEYLQLKPDQVVNIEYK